MTAGVGEVFAVALRLGLTSFGGPIAHLGFFREEYVTRRRWVSDEAYSEIVALCQLLPGPASSQVGFAIGWTQRRLAGALAAFVGFSLPSALVLAGFGALVATGDVAEATWLRALKIVAVAVVLDAVLGMGARLAATARTATVAAATFAVIVLVGSPLAQVGALVAAGLVGTWLFRGAIPAGPSDLPLTVSRRWGLTALLILVGLLTMLPVLASTGVLAQLAAIHLRAGALVFGGGHVVLPLLEESVVTELMDSSTFLAGYGMAQAVPGPLFTFGSYLGQVVAGPAGALVATVFIFLPGFLLLVGVLPFWSSVRSNVVVQAALVGVNAAVVGVLAAALYDPIIVTTLLGPVEVVFAAALFVSLHFWRVPPWAVVLAAVLASPLLEVLAR
jgi:chromate transporter